MYTSAAMPEAEFALQSIAFESNVFSNMAKSFAARFSPLTDFLAQSFSFGGSAPKEDLELTRTEIKLCNRLHGANFVAASKVRVSTPPGWNVNLVDVRPVIADMMVELRNFEADVLQPFYIYLSSYISNKEAKVKGKDNTFLYKKMEQKRVAGVKYYSQYFGDQTNQGQLPLGRLISRAADLNNVFDDIQRTRKAFGEIDFVAYKELINRIVGLLKSIIEQLEAGQAEGMPAETASTIAAGSYEIARQAELMSVHAMVVMNYLAFAPNLVIALQAAEKEGVI